MLNYQALAKKNRFEGLGALFATFAGVFATVASITVVTAQTAFEFEDPLDDLREQLGMPATEGGQGANVAGQVPASGADGAGAMSSFGLFAIAAAILLALVVGLVWWLGRKRRARRYEQDGERDVYTTDDYSPPRHALESGSAVTRERTGRLDTREEAAPSKSTFGTAAAATTAAASAAMILSDEADPVEEVTAKVEKPKSTDRNDPENWQKPNLDRLKESIREDWTSKGTPDVMDSAKTTASAAVAATSAAASTATDKVSAATESVTTKIDDFRSDDDTFNSMFGDDAAPVEYSSARETSFAGQIEGIATDDNASATAGDLEAGAVQSNAPAVPSRNDALKRIKALRESVKAG